MKIPRPPRRSQGEVVRQPPVIEGQGIDPPAYTAAPSKPSQTPAHPALGYWDINRKLEMLEQGCGHDLEKKSAEIEYSSVANPRGAAVFYMSERLKKYVEEIELVYQAEIEAGRFADTADLWAAVYSQKILPLVQPKIHSVMASLAFTLMRTGGGGPGEQATVQEAQRELSRLKARLESELASAIEHMELAGSAETLSPSPNASTMGQNPVPLRHREVVGVERAIIVERIRREIIEIAEAVELSEDYDTRIRHNRKFANNTTVLVCNRHPDLKEKLCLIKTTNKPRIIEIACEIATRSVENRETKPISCQTFQDAHKRYGRKARERLNQRSDNHV